MKITSNGKDGEETQKAQRERIGRHDFVAVWLQHYYAAISREAIPQHLLDLLQRLEEAEKEKRGGG